MDAKKLGTCSRDVISSLPDEVLGKILSLLPTEQAVSTSVLSKTWRNVYRLVDSLDFDDSVWGEDKLFRKKKKWFGYTLPEKFKKFVDTTLALRCDYPIKSFSLKCHLAQNNKDQNTCVGRWISNVLERGVLELDLRMTDLNTHFLPSQLFKSKTLVKLTLGTGLYLDKLPSDLSLPSLKTLFIDSVCFHWDDLCGVLLARCPVLEKLSVHYKRFSGRPHTISSPTIKRLSLKYDSPYYVYSWKSCMSFDLPKLVYLDYSDVALYEYPRVNLESLIEAKLDLYLVKDGKWSPDVTNLVLGIRNVKILHLSPVSVDVISGCVDDGLVLLMFNNLVKLSFGSYKNKRGWKLLASLLKQSPKLETLIITDLNGYSREDVSMPLNKVKMLHILGYGETSEAKKQMKSFVEEFKCLEMVEVGVVGEDNSKILQTRIYLMGQLAECI